MQDRPSADELLDAVAAYLFAELRPTVPHEERFRVLYEEPYVLGACGVGLWRMVYWRAEVKSDA